MKTLILALCLIATGCESAPVQKVRKFAHDHPVVTSIGVGVLAGSIAASANHGDSNKQPATGAVTAGPNMPCTPQPNGSCR